MTITTSASSAARTQALNMTAQQKHGGHVQFSLPPVQGNTASATKSKGGVTQLPIATSASNPATSTTAQALGSAAGHGMAAASHGNAVSARMISRLYQGKS